MEQMVISGLGLVKRVTRSQSPLDIKEYAGFKIVLYIWNIQLYMLKGYKGKVDLMELEAQRTGEKRQEEEKRTKESLNTEHGEGAFLM